MRHSLYFTTLSVISALAPVIGTIAAFSVAPQSAIAVNIGSTRDFRACAFDLQRVGIAAEEAAVACSAALYPRDIGRCVSRINQNTDIPPLDALFTCRRVRRPSELATCVVDISRLTQGVFPTDILDNCRRSLLPTRLSQCVVGLSRQTDVPAPLLINACIDGRDRPRDFYPTLLPLEDVPTPATPAPNPAIPSPRI